MRRRKMNWIGFSKRSTYGIPGKWFTRA